ncbi:hypothetical protein PO909_032438 [Leuciscus waleckii]
MARFFGKDALQMILDSEEEFTFSSEEDCNLPTNGSIFKSELIPPRIQVQKTAMMEEKLVVVVSGYPELYDFTNRNYHNVIKKQLAWGKVSVAIEMSEEECKRKWKYLRDKYLKERRAEKEKRSGAEGGSHKRWKFMAVMSFLEPHVKERPTTSNYNNCRPIDNLDCTVESLLLPMVSQFEEDDDLLTGTFEPPSLSSTLLSISSTPVMSTSTPTSIPAISTSTSVVETPVQPNTNRESGRGRKRRVEHGGELAGYQRELLKAVNKPLDEDDIFFTSLIPAMKRLPPRNRADIRLKCMQLLNEAEFGDD